jgi:hypothetical protein
MVFPLPLAGLINGLWAEPAFAEQSAQGTLSGWHLWQISRDILAHSTEWGWRAERVAFVQAVIVTPHRLSAEQMDTVLFEVLVGLDHASLCVAAAVNQPSPEAQPYLQEGWPRASE